VSSFLILKTILSPILILAALLYAGIMLLRNFLYDLNIFKAIEIENTKVISIGNITAGGTGKTPITAFLVQALMDHKISCGIISRGYKANYKEASCQVMPELNDAAQIFGDEPTWLAKSLKPVPVWVGKDKSRTAQAMMAATEIKPVVIIADDAFQHRRLKRDLDILVIDASVSWFDYLPLPLSRGREDFLLGVRRADIIILNKTNLAQEHRLKKMRSSLAVLKSKQSFLVEASTQLIIILIYPLSKAFYLLHWQTKIFFW